jgi:hypothetical protein
MAGNWSKKSGNYRIVRRDAAGAWTVREVAVKKGASSSSEVRERVGRAMSTANTETRTFSDSGERGGRDARKRP